MAIGLKNSGSIISYVLQAMQWEVNEQCVQYSECGTFNPFIDVGKPVFHIEYPDQVKADFVAELCSTSGPGNGSTGFSTVLKHYKLDGFVQYCNGMNATTPT
jgi:Glycoside-hydrolase family GH114